MITWPDELPTLSAGDLTLRPWRADEIDAVYNICQDPDTQFFTTVPIPYTHADAEKWLLRQAKGFEDKTDFALAVEVDGKVAVQLSAFDSVTFEHIIKIGYATAPEFRGKGYTARALEVLVDYLFALGYRRVSADTLPENIGSKKTLLKAGFYLESTQQMAMTHRDGTQTDGLVFAKLAPEYRS
jgi:RimJ/RimL family protein N-acetyltransferase